MLQGVIALDLARQMLDLYPDSYALVVSHENITNNYYGGKDKSMLSECSAICASCNLLAAPADSVGSTLIARCHSKLCYCKYRPVTVLELLSYQCDPCCCCRYLCACSLQLSVPQQWFSSPPQQQSQ